MIPRWTDEMWDLVLVSTYLGSLGKASKESYSLG